MSYQPSRRTAAHQTPIEPTDLDAFLLDDEFDDALDSQIAVIRESLADLRNN